MKMVSSLQCFCSKSFVSNLAFHVPMLITLCFASLEQFGCLVWSHSETHLLYVAERKRPKAESFFQVYK